MSVHGRRAFEMRRLVVPSLLLVATGLTLEALYVAGGHRLGLDFDVYRAAGNSVLHGTSVFDPALTTSMRYPLPFTYPPLAALLAVPFALVGSRMGLALWDAVSVVALVFVVRAAAQPLLRRQTQPIMALTLAVLVALALAPVVVALDLGQVGIPLMAMCLFDCMVGRPRWPRGVMIGIATAVKLLPAIFIPYLWLSGRRRAAANATAVAAACSLVTFAILPHDSQLFWTERVFDNSRVGSVTYFSNQSLYGMARRAVGAHGGLALALCVPLAVVVVVFGLRNAVRASRRGQELLGVSIAALVGVLVSPVSWVHHLVWIVPVLAVVIGDATDRRRVALAVSVAALFALRLPYLARSIPHGWGLAWLAGPLKDSYGLACLALLFVLPRLIVPRSPRAAPLRPAPAVPSSS